MAIGSTCIPKYLSFAKEKNVSTDVRHFVYTGNCLSSGMPVPEIYLQYYNKLYMHYLFKVIEFINIQMSVYATQFIDYDLIHILIVIALYDYNIVKMF